MTQILLTGAGGFLGKALLEYLPENDFTVNVWNQKTDGSLLSKGDRRNKLERHESQIVIHLAWSSISDENYDLHPQNKEFGKATIEFRNEVIAEGARFIGIGSVYENLPTEDGNLYQSAKKEISESFANDNYLDTTWVIPSYIFSFSQKRPRVIKAITNNPQLVIKNLTETCDWIEVRDVAAAINKLTQVEIIGKVNLRSGYATTVPDFLKEFSRVRAKFSDLENLDGSLEKLQQVQWQGNPSEIEIESSGITAQYLEYQGVDKNT